MNHGSMWGYLERTYNKADETRVRASPAKREQRRAREEERENSRTLRSSWAEETAMKETDLIVKCL